MRTELLTTRRFRRLLVSVTALSALIGGITGYVLGGVGAAIFCAAVVGSGAAAGFWLTFRAHRG